MDSEIYIGSYVYIRTSTYHWVGKVVHVSARSLFLHPAEAVFNNASDRAGAWQAFFERGEIADSAPVKTTEALPVEVSRLSTTDVIPWQQGGEAFFGA